MTLDDLRRTRGRRPEWMVRVWDVYLDERRDKHVGGFPGFIYFAQAGRRGPIKIGYTQKDVESRVRDLQTGNPQPLYILGYCAGDRYLEKKLHHWFEDWRLQGEWFRAGTFGLPELIEHINSRLPL